MIATHAHFMHQSPQIKFISLIFNDKNLLWGCDVPTCTRIVLKGLRQWRIKEWRGEQVMRNIYESFYLPSSISIQRGSGRSSSNIIGEWYNFQFNIYNAIKILFETFSSSSSLFAHKCRRRRWKILDMKAGNHVRQMKIKTK